MHAEPDIDLLALRDLMRHRYARDVAHLEFVPKGLDSWSYIAEVLGGSRVFLKLLQRTGPDAPRPRGAELPLMSALADLGLRLPRPIAARDGGLMSRFGRFELVVFEYLDGQTLEDETAWPDPLYARVAGVMAAIHGSTATVRHLVPGAEHYELPFLPPLVDALDRLVAGTPFPARDHPTLAGLRDLLAPRAPELRELAGVLEALRDRARERGGDTVLCHTDLWGSNLLLDQSGELNVLDWDGARIGPPEHDLFMFAGTDFFPSDRFGWFLDHYEVAFRQIPLDADVFGFYFYRRNIEDLAEFVALLTKGDADDADMRAGLRVVAELVGEWPELEKRIAAVRQLLNERA
ncbi:MAG: phosphotransferase family protein [Candidatus Limnocylindrales bacterium]